MGENRVVKNVKANCVIIFRNGVWATLQLLVFSNLKI